MPSYADAFGRLITRVASLKHCPIPMSLDRLHKRLALPAGQFEKKSACGARRAVFGGRPDLRPPAARTIGINDVAPAHISSVKFQIESSHSFFLAVEFFLANQRRIRRATGSGIEYMGSIKVAQVPHFHHVALPWHEWLGIEGRDFGLANQNPRRRRTTGHDSQ